MSQQPKKSGGGWKHSGGGSTPSAGQAMSAGSAARPFFALSKDGGPRNAVVATSFLKLFRDHVHSDYPKTRVYEVVTPEGGIGKRPDLIEPELDVPSTASEGDKMKIYEKWKIKNKLYLETVALTEQDGIAIYEKFMSCLSFETREIIGRTPEGKAAEDSRDLLEYLAVFKVATVSDAGELISIKYSILCGQFYGLAIGKDEKFLAYYNRTKLLVENLNEVIKQTDKYQLMQELAADYLKEVARALGGKKMSAASLSTERFLLISEEEATLQFIRGLKLYHGVYLWENYERYNREAKYDITLISAYQRVTEWKPKPKDSQDSKDPAPPGATVPLMLADAKKSFQGECNYCHAKGHKERDCKQRRADTAKEADGKIDKAVSQVTSDSKAGGGAARPKV